jgi:adenylate cyclase
MNTQEFKRKLTAVFSADVAGYSRLMGEDEVTTVKTLEAYKQVMFSLIRQHRGRVIDSPGDNLLAEFASVVDAVQCGVAVQKELQARNADLPENRKMQFRIGINLGDVIEEGDRIYGDGVNIAARLESLADPGGICVSKTAFDHIEAKLPLGYHFLGEQTVKNIAKPVGAYKVLMEPRVTGDQRKTQTKAVRVWQRRSVLSGAVAVLIVIIGTALWNFYWRAPKFEPASKEKMAFALPDKPSIAVLPFVNMSGDPQQEYFSDGITEDLITDLSKVLGLFVIARNSTFVYKGKPVKIRQVAEDLGVRYVLEGSVRRAGDEVRINAQLIDATTGRHLWADRYDGSIKDVFSLQDKINQKITAALVVKLTAGEKVLVTQKGTDDPAAYEEFMKGREYYLSLTNEGFTKAEACFKRAIELDSKYSQAKAALALLYWEAGTAGKPWAVKMAYGQTRLRARKYLVEAMKEPTSVAYILASVMDRNLRLWDAALSEGEKALALDPNNALCNSNLGYTLILYGRPKEGMEYVKSAMRLDPLNPARYLRLMAIGHFCMGEWQEAATHIENALKLNPEDWSLSILLPIVYANLGRDEDAKAAARSCRRAAPPDPALTPQTQMYMWNFRDRGVADSFLKGLKKTGLLDPGPEHIYVSEEDQITGDNLKALLFPSTITGFMRNGSAWSLETSKDGTEILHVRELRGGMDTGRAWVEGDKYCQQFEWITYGLPDCQTVFKNPKGTPEEKNQYVSFSDVELSTFSRVK